MEIKKEKICINKKLALLLGILFSILVLIIISLSNKKSISLSSRASRNNSSRICAIDIKTMKNTNNCCNDEELIKGYRCYLNNYSINCNTKNVVKCGRDNCNNETGLCKNQPSTNPILPTTTQYNFKPSLCNLYGSSVKPESWQNQCCSQDDILTGRFKCIKTESTDGFIRLPVYYQFYCPAQRYWKCDGACMEDSPLCKKLIPTALFAVTPTPTAKPTPTTKPTPTARPTPTNIPLSPLDELSNTIDEYLIRTFRNIAKIWEQGAVLDLNNNSSQELHNIFNLLTSNNRYNDFTFSLKNDESFPPDGKFLYKDRESLLFYVFYPYNIPSSRYGNYGSYYNWVENNSLYRWRFTGSKITPVFSFPRVIMVDKTKNYLYLAPDIDDYELSTLSDGYPRDGETVTSGLPCLKDLGIQTKSCPFVYRYSFSQFNNRIFMFIGSVSSQCVLLEIYKTENNDIIFRGIFPNACI